MCDEKLITVVDFIKYMIKMNLIIRPYKSYMNHLTKIELRNFDINICLNKIKFRFSSTTTKLKNCVKS